MSYQPTQKSKKLLDQIRDAIRNLKHYCFSTEKTYVQWEKLHILFHNKRHPAEISSNEIDAFMTHLAKDENVSSSTQYQGLNALLFYIGMYCKSTFVFRCMLYVPNARNTCQRFCRRMKPQGWCHGGRDYIS